MKPVVVAGTYIIHIFGPDDYLVAETVSDLSLAETTQLADKLRQEHTDTLAEGSEVSYRIDRTIINSKYNKWRSMPT